MDSNARSDVTEDAAPTSPQDPSTTLPPDTLPADAGSLVVVDASGRRPIAVPEGRPISIGSDPASTIVVREAVVPPACAIVVRAGPGWLVTSVDPANPIRILDDTGRSRPVLDELGLRSGTLVAGATRILLEPPASGS